MMNKYQTQGQVQNEEQIAQSRFDAVRSMVEQGVTDAEEMFNYLNFDEEGNEIGDFSIEEITEYLDALGVRPSEKPSYYQDAMESTEEIPEEEESSAMYMDEDEDEGTPIYADYEDGAAEEGYEEDEEVEEEMGSPAYPMARYGMSVPKFNDGGTYWNTNLIYPQARKGMEVYSYFENMPKKQPNHKLYEGVSAQTTKEFTNRQREDFKYAMGGLIETGMQDLYNQQMFGQPSMYDSGYLKKGGSNKLPKFQTDGQPLNPFRNPTTPDVFTRPQGLTDFQKYNLKQSQQNTNTQNQGANDPEYQRYLQYKNQNRGYIPAYYQNYPGVVNINPMTNGYLGDGFFRGRGDGIRGTSGSYWRSVDQPWAMPDFSNKDLNFRETVDPGKRGFLGIGRKAPTVTWEWGPNLPGQAAPPQQPTPNQQQPGQPPKKEEDKPGFFDRFRKKKQNQTDDTQQPNEEANWGNIGKTIGEIMNAPIQSKTITNVDRNFVKARYPESQRPVTPFMDMMRGLPKAEDRYDYRRMSNSRTAPATNSIQSMQDAMNNSTSATDQLIDSMLRYGIKDQYKKGTPNHSYDYSDFNPIVPADEAENYSLPGPRENRKSFSIGGQSRLPKFQNWGGNTFGPYSVDYLAQQNKLPSPTKPNPVPSGKAVFKKDYEYGETDVRNFLNKANMLNIFGRSAEMARNEMDDNLATNANTVYGTMPADTIDYGDIPVNIGIGATFRPNDYTAGTFSQGVGITQPKPLMPVTRMGGFYNRYQDGGAFDGYEVGDVDYWSDEQIQQFIEMGGEVDFLD